MTTEDQDMPLWEIMCDHGEWYMPPPRANATWSTAETAALAEPFTWTFDNPSSSVEVMRMNDEHLRWFWEKLSADHGRSTHAMVMHFARHCDAPEPIAAYMQGQMDRWWPRPERRAREPKRWTPDDLDRGSQGRK